MEWKKISLCDFPHLQGQQALSAVGSNQGQQELPWRPTSYPSALYRKGAVGPVMWFSHSCGARKGAKGPGGCVSMPATAELDV